MGTHDCRERSCEVWFYILEFPTKSTCNHDQLLQKSTALCARSQGSGRTPWTLALWHRLQPAGSAARGPGDRRLAPGPLRAHAQLRIARRKALRTAPPAVQKRSGLCAHHWVQSNQNLPAGFCGVRCPRVLDLGGEGQLSTTLSFSQSPNPPSAGMGTPI